MTRAGYSHTYDRSQMMRAMHGVMEWEKWHPEEPRPDSFEAFCEAVVAKWPGLADHGWATLQRYEPQVPPGTRLEDYTRLPHDPSFNEFRARADAMIKAGWVRGFIWPTWSSLAWVHKAELERNLGELVQAWRSAILLGAPW